MSNSKIKLVLLTHLCGAPNGGSVGSIYEAASQEEADNMIKAGIAKLDTTIVESGAADKVLENAKAEADKIIADAQAKADGMIEAAGVKAAEVQAASEAKTEPKAETKTEEKAPAKATAKKG